jgi:hypothetical protein
VNVPKVSQWPPNSVQCDDCGGHGCATCGDRGWLVPCGHGKGRRCENERCRMPIPPDCVAVYCSDECALEDA